MYPHLWDVCVYKIHVSTRYMCLRDTCICIREIHLQHLVRVSHRYADPTRPDTQSWDICITFERYLYNMHIYMYLTNVNTCISRIWRLDPSEIHVCLQVLEIRHSLNLCPARGLRTHTRMHTNTHVHTHTHTHIHTYTHTYTHTHTHTRIHIFGCVGWQQE